MLRGSAWAARRDQAFVLVEDPQQRHLADWREQRTRRRAELQERTARRQAEFTALLPAIAAQVAADVSAAVEAALRTTRVGHHEGLIHAPTTTSAPTASVADDHDLNRAPATTTTVNASVTPPVSTVLGNDPDMATSYGSDLAARPPTTCSTNCPGRAAVETHDDVTSAAPSKSPLDSTPAAVLSSSTATPTLAPAASRAAPSTKHDSPKGDLTPEARDVSTMLRVPSQIDVIYDAVDIEDAVPAVSAHNTCSAEYPSDDAHASVSVDISPATPNSATTTCCVVPELAAPAVSDKALDVDEAHLLRANVLPTEPVRVELQLSMKPLFLISEFVHAATPVALAPAAATRATPDVSYGIATSVVNNDVANAFSTPMPSTCSMLVGNIGSGDTPTVANLTQGMLPAFPLPAEDTTCDMLFRFDVLEQRPLPWPSFECSRVQPSSEFMWKIMGINSGDDTRYGDINGWFGLNAVDGDHKAKPAAGCMVIATRIKHDLDSECSILLRCCRSVGLLLVAIGLRLVVQLSGYWQVLKTVELQWNALIIVIPFAIVVRCAQLQPTTFKWTDQPCHATHSLIASTCMDMLLEFLLAGRAIGTFWTWCDIGNLHCSPGSTSFAIPDWKMLITVNCDFARVHFRWTITVQQSTSSVLFLASLDGRAEIYHQLQGNYHCPELMHWSFSQSLMLPEDLFYTPGYILVCCCALMQWKIPWITRLVSWKSYFRCCRAEHGPLYSYEYFQWTNSHSCPWLFNCLLLVKVVELKPLPSWGLLLCSYVVNKNLDIFHESLHSFGNVQWTISCCSFSVLDGCSAVPIFVWLELKIKSSQGSHVEFNASNRNGKLHDLVEMVEPKLWSPALTSCLCGAPGVLINSVLTLKCIYSKSSSYLEVPIWNAICIMFSTSKKLHAGESYWLLDLYSSCDLLVSEYAAHFGSQTLEWKNPWCFCPCHAVSSSNKLEMQLVGGHSKISVAFSFCWAMSSTIHIVIYLPGACIIQWGSEMMSWENASSIDGIFSCVNRVLITSWDPRGLYPILVASWNITHLQFKHLTWDPGGSTLNIGLRASRNLRRGDCQRPSFTCYWAGWVGRQLGPWPAWEPDASAYIWTELPHWDLAWNGTVGLGLEGEDRLGLACVAWSTSSSRFPNLLVFFL